MFSVRILVALRTPTTRMRLLRQRENIQQAVIVQYCGKEDAVEESRQERETKCHLMSKASRFRHNQQIGETGYVLRPLQASYGLHSGHMDSIFIANKLFFSLCL